MSATLDWSHDLLSESEQVLFRRLSVFSGGFSLEAAEAVGAIGEPEVVLGLLGALVEQSLVRGMPQGGGGAVGAVWEPEVVRGLLGALVEQSLVRAMPNADGVRYGMLEPVRQYAVEKLEQSGEAEEARQRRARHYVAFAERAESQIKGDSEGGRGEGVA